MNLIMIDYIENISIEMLVFQEYSYYIVNVFSVIQCFYGILIMF